MRIMYTGSHFRVNNFSKLEYFDNKYDNHDYLPVICSERYISYLFKRFYHIRRKLHKSDFKVHALGAN